MLIVIYFDTMKLTKREAQILDFLLEKSVTVVELASAISIKKSNLSKYLKKLACYNLVEIKKGGRQRTISLHPFIFSSFISARSKFPFLKLSDVLVGRTPSFLAFIKSRKAFTISDIDLPAITSKRLLKRLRSLGLIHMEKRGVYELRADALPLSDFCRGILVALDAFSFSKEIGGGMTITQPSFDSARGIELVHVTGKQAKPKGYWPTALSVFDRYGVHLISAGKFYYANIKPGIADVIIHTLALSRDARNISYVAAIMLRNRFNPRKLLGKRQLFGLDRDFINDLIRFMETRGGFAPPGFPSWKEVEGVAHAV